MPTAAKHSIMQREDFLWKHAAHDEWTLIIPLSGRFSCTMQGRTWIVSEGELCFFPQGVIFDRYIIEKLKFHYIRMKWNCPDEALRESNFYPVGCVNLSDKDRLQSTLHMLATVDQTPALKRSEIPLHYIRDIWMQYLMDYTNIVEKYSTHTNDPIINKAIEYIERNVHTLKSISDVARYCNLSPTQFSKRFSECVGVSPVKYLTNLRIQKAQKLLSESDLSVSQIASMCGYESPFYFSKRFRDIIGISPQYYKNDAQKI